MPRFLDRLKGKWKRTAISDSPTSQPPHATPLLSPPFEFVRAGQSTVQRRTHSEGFGPPEYSGTALLQSNTLDHSDVPGRRTPVSSGSITQSTSKSQPSIMSPETGTMDFSGTLEERADLRGDNEDANQSLGDRSLNDLIQPVAATLTSPKNHQLAHVQPKDTGSITTATTSDGHSPGIESVCSKSPKRNMSDELIHRVPPVNSGREVPSVPLVKDHETKNPGYSTGSSSSDPMISQYTTQLRLSIENSQLYAGRDQNITITANKDEPILRQLRADLSPVFNAAYDSYDADQRSKCFENTRVQVLRDIQKWISGEGNQAPIYVLDGVAGIGKSTVAQTVAEGAAKDGILGASYFFTRNEEQRMTAKYFCATIAFQLACYADSFARQISEVLEQHPDAVQKTIHQQLLLLLINPLQRSSISNKQPILIVVDALDECKEDEAETLLTLFAQNIRSAPQIKVFMTTRPEWRLRMVLDRDTNHELFRLHEIDDVVVQSDIRFYLCSRLSAARIMNLFPNRHPPWQPSAKEMESLCGVCGTLFIIASTAEKFILDTKRMNPGKQLTRLLEGVFPPDFSGSKYTDVMDRFYIQIIRSAAPDDLHADDDWTDRYQVVIGAIIVLRTPLPCSALAALLDMNSADIEDTLLHLHSLVAPSGKDLVFRVHHKSFPDFITNEDRIRRALGTAQAAGLTPAFVVVAKERHLQLAKACFRIMNANLKENVADLTCDDWYKDKNEIEKLKQWPISEQLRYAIKHWASHLCAAGELDDELKQELHRWASESILAWLEVTCILDITGNAHEILEKGSRALEEGTDEWIERTAIMALLSDAARLVLQSGEALKLSPMHVHWSGFPFVPTQSNISRVHVSKTGLKVLSGVEARWDPMLATIRGHSSSVNSVAFSPDGTRLASASDDQTVRLWEGKTGSHIATLNGHSSFVNVVAFSPDGTRLASGSHDPTVWLWEGTSGSPIAILNGHSSQVNAIAFSPDDMMLISASSDKTVRLWEAKTGLHVATLNGHSSSVHAIAVSPDSRILASASHDRTVILWEGKTGLHKATLRGHLSSINAVAFSPDGARLASASYDKTVRLWDGKTGLHIATLSGHVASVIAVTFSPDGTRLASASDEETVWLWEGKTGAHVASLTGHSSYVKAIAFSPNGNVLASASSDKTVRLWEGITGAYLATLGGHTGAINAVTFSPDCTRLASASSDETVRLWEGRTRSDVATRSGHSSSVNAIAFAPDGTRYVSVSEDKTVKLWDAKTGSHIATLTGHSSHVGAVAFSADSTVFASGSDDKTVRIWKAKTGSPLANLGFHSSNVIAVAFSSDGTRLTSASDDLVVMRWARGRLRTTLLRTFYCGFGKPARRRTFNLNAIAFSPDGTRLASAPDGETVELWYAETGRHIAALVGHFSYITALTFSPDGKRLASASYDQTVRLWDGRTGVPIASLAGHLSSVRTLAFSPDGTVLASASRYETIQFWDGQHNSCVISFNTRLTLILSLAFLPERSEVPSQTNPATISNSSASPRRVVMAVRRRQPPLFGLVVVSLLHGNVCITAPICWFPPHLHVNMMSLDPTGSLIAVGCKDGAVFLFDVSALALPC